jgi:TetR/AcrR family transcriptional regulator, cholesterol catabolism regulator
LIEHRHRFEQLFAEIVSEIPLRKSVDRTYFRLGLLGALAWCYIWYNPKERDSPKVIAKKMINLFGAASLTSCRPSFSSHSHNAARARTR